MRRAFHRSFIESLDHQNVPVDATPWLRTLMRCKSPRELTIIRESCAILDAATKALAQAKRAGAPAYGVRPGGRTCRPLPGGAGCPDIVQHRSRPDSATLRTGHRFYRRSASSVCCRPSRWLLGEGFVSLAAAEHPVLVKAAEALKTVITAQRPAPSAAILRVSQRKRSGPTACTR